MGLSRSARTCFMVLAGMLLFSNAFSQYKAEEFQPAFIETKFGAMIIYNGSKNSFTLRIHSKSIEQTEQENFLMIDKKLVQSSIIPFMEKFDFNKLSVEQQKQLLTGYKEYEKEYIQEQLKSQLADYEQFLTLEGKIFKYWSFTMPPGNDSVSKQIYLFTICFDQILILNGPVLKKESENELKGVLINLAKTIELFPNKIQDVRKLYFDLNN